MSLNYPAVVTINVEKRGRFISSEGSEDRGVLKSSDTIPEEFVKVYILDFQQCQGSSGAIPA